MTQEYPDEIEVTVTEEHINKGKQKSLCDCPIALAVKEQFSTNNVLVGGTLIIDSMCSYYCPDEVLEFIQNFDNDKEVFSFTFKAIQINDY